MTQSVFRFLFVFVTLTGVGLATYAAKRTTLNVLFIGNSYTARHNLADVVKEMAEAGNPGLTLRFINDAHLNQTLAYLTACTLYAAIFDKSPQGLSISQITDIRFLENDKSKDRDGLPITKVFSKKDRTDLQRIAWEGYQEFLTLRNY